MSFDRAQFRDLVRRSLERRGLHSRAAENILLGTAAQESDFGTYLLQRGGGPAIGAFQMEPTTFDWLRGKFMPRFPELVERDKPGIMEWDLDFACFMARLRYAANPEPLPPAQDVKALGEYWKRIYNTIHGAGTVAQFMSAYAKYVKET